MSGINWFTYGVSVRQGGADTVVMVEAPTRRGAVALGVDLAVREGGGALGSTVITTWEDGTHPVPYRIARA